MTAPDGADWCVVGSGPGGIAAAVALTRQGKRVRLVDAGAPLEDERREVVERLSRHEPREWDPRDLAAIREGSQATSAGIPLKRSFGSTYPFDAPARSYELALEGADIRPSFARGGLSTVWGAGVLPFHHDDIADWPIDPRELDAHYRETLAFLPLAGARDDLEGLFPLHCDAPGDMPPSPQAAALLRDAGRHRDALRRRGITVGRSRLAVQARGCRRCGQCLYGCPYGLIYNSASTLAQLRSQPGFEYLPDFVVEEVREEGRAVRVAGRDRRSGAPRELTTGRVFLGAGVVSSGAILMRSLGLEGRRLAVRDSPYFLMPLLRFHGPRDPAADALHTMAQAYILLRDPGISPHYVHLSVYTYNDLMEPTLRASGGPLGKRFATFWRGLAARMLVGGTYLHSRHSPGFTLRFERTACARERVVLECGGSLAEVHRLARRVGWKLARASRALRAVPLVPLIRHSLPGRGFHAGASFPLSRDGGPFKSDLAGRPHGLQRVHLVDASALPTIPATTVTFATMALAHRTATVAARELA